MRGSVWSAGVGAYAGVVGGAYGVPVSGIAAGRERYGRRGCRALRAGRGESIIKA